MSRRSPARRNAQSAAKRPKQRNVAVEQRKLADMQLALQAWEEGDLQRANDLIEASRPAPGQPPGFEWRYLRKLCQDQSIEPSATPTTNTDRRYSSIAICSCSTTRRRSPFTTFPAGKISCCSKIRMESGRPPFVPGTRTFSPR